jgi:hypothetical protein
MATEIELDTELRVAQKLSGVFALKPYSTVVINQINQFQPPDLN